MSSELKMVDDTKQLDEDSYETDSFLFERMEINYGLMFRLDVAATKDNTKCPTFLEDALHTEWNHGGQDVWCNPPHSMNEDFIKRADAQHKKWNINICMIVPTNCQSMPTWHKLIENEFEVITENHPILKRPTFLKNGRKTKFPSRNAYRVIVWRKR